MECAVEVHVGHQLSYIPNRESWPPCENAHENGWDALASDILSVHGIL